MDKQLFDDAIGEVPRSTVDVDAAITRGRRAARIHQVANPAVAAGVAVVLLVGAVAYTMTRDDPGGMAVGTPPTSTTSPTARTTNTTSRSTPKPVAPPSCARTDLENAEQLNVRLTGIVRSALQQQRPDVTLKPNPDSTGLGLEPPLAFYQVNGTRVGSDKPICDEDSYAMAMATTQGPEGAGNVTVLVQPSFYGPETLTCEGSSHEDVLCKVVTLPSGDTVVKRISQFEGGTEGTRVDIIRPDRTLVTVLSENIDTSVKSGGGPTATAPPLNLDQLIAIGTAQGMTMFP
jgi:hypothetical protein